MAVLFKFSFNHARIIARMLSIINNNRKYSFHCLENVYHSHMMLRSSRFTSPNNGWHTASYVEQGEHLTAS